MGLFSFTQEIAMDLGTANTIILHNGKIVVDEPSVVALDRRTDKMIAVGGRAKLMHEKTNENIKTIRPLRDGVIADFNASGIKAAEVEYHEARWKKAVWNMPFNGMTVVMDAQTDKLLQNPSTMALIRRQMLEVIGAARALGVQNIDESFADRMIQNTLDMVPYSPSMKLDHDFHRPMEIDYLYTRAIAEAHQVGFAMPCLEMLEAQLRFIQEKRI